MKKDTLKISLLLGLFVVTIIVSIFTSPKVTQSFTSKGSGDFSNQNNHVGVIELLGPISFSSSSTMLSKVGAENILQQIEDMENDDRIKALILRINSPGGTVGASQEIFERLLRFKAKRNIPIIASIGDVGASGAYYAALSADTIFANPGSLVGSIGVIMGNVNFSKLIEKHGVRFDVYKSGQYKDSLTSWRDPTTREKKLLQNVVDNVHSQFEKAVVNNRSLSKNQASSLAQGQIFTGEQAKEKNLIDELGTFEDTLYFAAKLLGSKERPIIVSKSTPSVYDFFSFWEGQLGGRLNGLSFKPQFFKLQ
jgi:protease IV